MRSRSIGSRSSWFFFRFSRAGTKSDSRHAILVPFLLGVGRGFRVCRRQSRLVVRGANDSSRLYFSLLYWALAPLLLSQLLHWTRNNSSPFSLSAGILVATWLVLLRGFHFRLTIDRGEGVVTLGETYGWILSRQRVFEGDVCLTLNDRFEADAPDCLTLQDEISNPCDFGPSSFYLPDLYQELRESFPWKT